MKSILVLSVILGQFLLSGAAGVWNYTDQAAWSSMPGSQCSGSNQSPINFPPMVEMVHSENLKAFTFTGYDQLVTSPTIVNNGHSVTVTFTNDARVSGGDLGSTFKAAQFHFHWGNDNTRGSEHTYNGMTYPAELHVVHYNTKYADISEAVSKPDGLAVLGFFIEVGPIHNCNFGPVIDALKNVPDKGNTSSLTPFKLRHMLPMQLRDYYRYMGSLTTPPCSETVKWTVFRDRLYMSEEQLQEFRKIYFDLSKSKVMVDNWRPPQPRNGRKVYISFDVNANSSPVHLVNLSLASFIFCVQWLAM